MYGDTDALLGRIARMLAQRFDGTVPRESVDRYVRETYGLLYRSSAVKRYLPVVTERFAVERLTALAQVHGSLGRSVPEVLYVPATRYVDWRIAEPEGAPIEAVRGIRDHIDVRVRELLTDLTDVACAT